MLEVIYLIFNEGYTATAGDDWMRPELCEDALRLGRILAELTPREPEVHGLVALLEIQASRSRARVSPSGAPVLLLDQNRAQWDQLLIRRGLKALDRADALGGARGPYALQAAIAACHAQARTAAETDWARIVALYEMLARLVPSPVVELNRAVAVAMAFGPQAGLDLVDALVAEPSLENYHLLPSVRGDLLVKLNRLAEARTEFERRNADAQCPRTRVAIGESTGVCRVSTEQFSRKVKAQSVFVKRFSGTKIVDRHFSPPAASSSSTIFSTWSGSLKTRRAARRRSCHQMRKNSGSASGSSRRIRSSSACSSGLSWSWLFSSSDGDL